MKIWIRFKWNTKKRIKEQKNAIKDVKTLYKSQEKVIKLFDDYPRIVYIKILTPKQMFQRL